MNCDKCKKEVWSLLDTENGKLCLECYTKNKDAKVKTSGLATGYIAKPGLTEKENAEYHRIANLKVGDLSDDDFEKWNLFNEKILDAINGYVRGDAI